MVFLNGQCLLEDCLVGAAISILSVIFEKMRLLGAIVKIEDSTSLTWLIAFININR